MRFRRAEPRPTPGDRLYHLLGMNLQEFRNSRNALDKEWAEIAATLLQ